MPLILILNWSRQQLCGLFAESQRGQRSIRHVYLETWTSDVDPLQSAEVIKRCLSAGPAVPEQIVVCLPREEVILRHLDVPDVPDDELPALVSFQAASRSTLPLDQLLLDYLPLPKPPGHEGRPVVAVTVAKSLVRGIQAILKTSGLEAASVTFSSIGLAEFIAGIEQQHGNDARKPVLAVLKDGNRVELVILMNRQLLYAHSARLSSDDSVPAGGVLAEVSRTLVAAQRLHPQLAVHHAWGVGDIAASPELIRQMADRLTVPVTAVELTDLQRTELPPGTSKGNQGQCAVLLGLAAQPADRLTAAFDFLNPRRPPKKIDLRKQRLMIGAAAALLIAVLTTSAMQWTRINIEQQLDRLRIEEADLDLKIKPGQATLAAAKLVDDWQTGNLNQLQQLSAIEDLMEGTGQLYLTQYAFTPGPGDAVGTLQSFGNAKSREDIQQFYQRLIDTKTFRIQPRGLTQFSPDEEYPHRFELNAELLLKPKVTAEKPGS